LLCAAPKIYIITPVLGNGESRYTLQQILGNASSRQFSFQSDSHCPQSAKRTASCIKSVWSNETTNCRICTHNHPISSEFRWTGISHYLTLDISTYYRSESTPPLKDLKDLNRMLKIQSFIYSTHPDPSRFTPPPAFMNGNSLRFSAHWAEGLLLEIRTNVREGNWK